MRLYEAKVGIVEAQKKWDKRVKASFYFFQSLQHIFKLENSFTLGKKAQKGLKILMNKKQLMFKRKWACYQDQVSQFKSIWPVSRPVCPSLDEAKKLQFEDIFWNVGALAHPTEKWAVDPGTIEGIQVFLQHRSCNYDAVNGGRDLIELVQPGQRIAKDARDVNVEVLKSLHDNLRQKHCRTWMNWNSNIVELLQRSYVYTRMTAEEIDLLINRWEGLVSRGKSTWERIVNAESVESTALDELKIFEQDMLHGEEDDVAQLHQQVDQLYIMEDTTDEEDLWSESGMDGRYD
ncbi:hypothetical protein DFH28DRAFT_933554 [Melampsora americana]|nr:hypothetical protein DFH28DRAFT_933554 [Melampsora americana]